MIDILKLNSIDTAAGLDRLGGDTETYSIILEDYLDNYRNTYKLLVESLESGNQVDSERIIHTFKGISGSIGSPAV